MPDLTVTPSKRLTLINAVIAHWQGYNVRLGGTPATEFKVKGIRVVAELITLRDAYSATLTVLEGARNVRQTAAGVRDDKKIAIQKRIPAFNRAARYWFSDVPGQLNGLPNAPKFNANAGAFLQAFRDMQTLWTQYNALTGITGYTAPLLLADGTTLATFTTEFGSLETAFNDATRTTVLEKQSLGKRDADFRVIYKFLKDYSAAIKARLAPDSDIATSLPKLYDTSSPSPRPVTNIRYTYAAATNTVTLTFDPSPSANITLYTLRQSQVAPYDPENENDIDNKPPTAPFQFVFILSTVQPGESGVFKIYTDNETGNVKASRVITIKRPA